MGRDTLQLLGLTALWLAAKQEELLPPGLDQLVTLAAETYTEINFRHMELLILAKLELRLAAPTPAYLLNHLIAVEEERDWSEDLSRHMVEIVLEDHVLARQRPSRIAHAVYEAIKVKYIRISIPIYGVVLIYFSEFGFLCSADIGEQLPQVRAA